MSTTQKNPLHPSALTIKGLTPGRTILEFNIALGILGEHVVLEYPRVCTIHEVIGAALAVKLKSVATGITGYHYLTDMGVVTKNGWWNDLNFTIDRRKRHLLPELIPHPYGDDDTNWEDWGSLDDPYADYPFGT